MQVKTFLIPGLFALGGMATAEEPKIWGQADAWAIRVDTSEVARCLAVRTMPDSTEVEIGVAPTLDGGYVALRNAAWTGIEDGATGEIEFDFGTSRFGGEAAGRITEGVPGAYVFFDNPAFVQDFSRRQSVRIIATNGDGFELDLTGTSLAIRAVLACQDAQPGSRDPG